MLPLTDGRCISELEVVSCAARQQEVCAELGGVGNFPIPPRGTLDQDKPGDTFPSAGLLAGSSGVDWDQLLGSAWVKIICGAAASWPSDGQITPCGHPCNARRRCTASSGCLIPASWRSVRHLVPTAGTSSCTSQCACRLGCVLEPHHWQLAECCSKKRTAFD